MPKDFTDYVALIHSAGDRVVDYKHIRVTDGIESEFRWNDHVYDFNRDLAYQVSWAPWRKIIDAEPKVRKTKEIWHFKGENGLWGKREVIVKKTKKPWVTVRPVATLVELFRSKKVGLLIYQEPCTHKCSICPHSEATERCPTGKVEPIHISKIHQPSGEIGSVTMPFTTQTPKSILLRRMSPFTLKMIVDSADKYRNAYKSYAFGTVGKLASKWIWIVVAVAVVAVFLLLFSGAIPLPKG